MLAGLRADREGLPYLILTLCLSMFTISMTGSARGNLYSMTEGFSDAAAPLAGSAENPGISTGSDVELR
jgi:hypothetical protein